MKYKSIIILLLLFILSFSCQSTIKSSVTHIEYTGEISERGLSITAKPPLWQWCVDLYKIIIK